MGDIALDNFMARVKRSIDDWKGELDAIAPKLKKVDEEFAKVEAIKSPSPDDKKRLEACKTTREKLRKQVDDAHMNLYQQMVLRTAELPDKNKDNEKDLIDLPNWARKLIKDKGLQVFKGVTLVPTFEIDFKAKKIKSFGIKITW